MSGLTIIYGICPSLFQAHGDFPVGEQARALHCILKEEAMHCCSRSPWVSSNLFRALVRVVAELLNHLVLDRFFPLSSLFWVDMKVKAQRSVCTCILFLSDVPISQAYAVKKKKRTNNKHSKVFEFCSETNQTPKKIMDSLLNIFKNNNFFILYPPYKASDLNYTSIT